MVRTVSVAIFALLCVSLTVAAPTSDGSSAASNNAGDAEERDTVACNLVVQDIELKLKNVLTEEKDLVLLVPNFYKSVANCVSLNASNPPNLLNCMKGIVTDDENKVKTDIKQFQQNLQALEKDVQSIPQKCLPTAGGNAAT